MTFWMYQRDEDSIVAELSRTSSVRRMTDDTRWRSDSSDSTGCDRLIYNSNTDLGYNKRDVAGWIQNVHREATHRFELLAIALKKVKCMILYNTVSALHFTVWQTCSFRNQLDFSGKHSVMPQLLCEDYLLTFPLLSRARHSYVSSWVNWSIVERTKMPNLRNSSK